MLHYKGYKQNGKSVNKGNRKRKGSPHVSLLFSNLQPRMNDVSGAQDPLRCAPIIRRRAANLGSDRTIVGGRLASITIPEPFKMTLRGNMPNSSKQRTLQEAESEIECLRKFRATPVPAHVFLPLYETMTREQRRKRFESTERRKENMLALQLPFNFAYDDRHRSRRRSNSVPNFTSDEEQNTQLEKPLRAEAVDREPFFAKFRPSSAAVIPRRKLYEKKSHIQMTNDEKLFQECNKKPAVRTMDRSVESRRFGMSAGKKLEKKSKAATPLPFNVSQKVQDRGLSTNVAIESDRRFRRRSRTVSDYNDLDNEEFPIAPKMTMAAVMRETTNQKRLQRKAETCESKSVESNKKQKDLNELKRIIASKAVALCAQTDSKDQAEKLKNFREADKARLLDYRQEMKNMTERVKNRPLLMEQQLQMCAARKVDRRFRECLRQRGIDEDLLLKNSLKANVTSSLGSSSPSEDRDTQSEDDDDDDDGERSAHKNGHSDEYAEDDDDDRDYSTVIEDSFENTLESDAEKSER